MNDVGNRIVENYNNAEIKSTGGLCFGLVADRVDQAYRDVCGENLTELFTGDICYDVFERLWRNHCFTKEWTEDGLFPRRFRGKGAAGALAYVGQGELVEQEALWEGALHPGAVIHIWEKYEDYLRVRDFNIFDPRCRPPLSYSHSFIFLEYVRDGRGNIIGMRIADQYKNEDGSDIEVYHKDLFQYWAGANITSGYPPGSHCNAPQAVRHMLSGSHAIVEDRAVNYNIVYCRDLNHLDAAKIVAMIKNRICKFNPAAARNAVMSLGTCHFNVYFARITALFQLLAGLNMDGRFCDRTCRSLCGKRRSDAVELFRTAKRKTVLRTCVQTHPLVGAAFAPPVSCLDIQAAKYAAQKTARKTTQQTTQQTTQRTAQQTNQQTTNGTAAGKQKKM